MEREDFLDPADVFHEDFHEDSDSDAMSDENEVMDTNAVHESIDRCEKKLAISIEQAKANYARAGTEVEEEPESITVGANTELIDPVTNAILDEIVEDIKLPYKVAEFQRVAINAVGQRKNLVLVSPTGSGKMNVPLLATLVLRQSLGIPKGIAIVTQPLSSIMNEKLKNDVCEAAVLSMAGDLTTCQDEDEDASLSCNLQDLLDGKFPVLFGHPESFDSKLGQHILRELQKLDRLILICIDEFHQVL